MASSLLDGMMQQHQKPLDNIPANLTENEYVIPADVVLIIGNGDPKMGAQKLDAFVQQIRQEVQGSEQS